MKILHSRIIQAVAVPGERVFWLRYHPNLPVPRFPSAPGEIPQELSGVWVAMGQLEISPCGLSGEELVEHPMLQVGMDKEQLRGMGELGGSRLDPSKPVHSQHWAGPAWFLGWNPCLFWDGIPPAKPGTVHPPLHRIKHILIRFSLHALDKRTPMGTPGLLQLRAHPKPGTPGRAEL